MSLRNRLQPELTSSDEEQRKAKKAKWTKLSDEKKIETASSTRAVSTATPAPAPASRSTDAASKIKQQRADHERALNRIGLVGHNIQQSYAPSSNRQYLGDLLGQPYDGRKLKQSELKRKKTSETNHYQVVFQNDNPAHSDLNGGIDFPTYCKNQAETNRVIPILRQLLEAYPFPLTLKMDRARKLELAKLARAIAYPGEQMDLNKVHNEKEGYLIRISFIRGTSGAFDTMSYHIKRAKGKVDLKHVIPPLPAKFSRPPTEESLAPGLKTEEIAMHKRVIECLYLLAADLHLNIMDPKMAATIAASVFQKYSGIVQAPAKAPAPSTSKPPINVKRIYSITKPRNVSYYLRPNEAFWKADIYDSKPNIISIGSMSKLKCALVTNALHNEWLLSKDPIKAWRAAIIINEALQLEALDETPHQPICTCPSTPTLQLEHPCINCLENSPCKALQWGQNPDGKLCSKCLKSEAAAIAADKVAATKEAAAQDMMRTRLEQEFFKLVDTDAKAIGLETDNDEVKYRKKDASSIKDAIQGQKFTDIYQNQDITFRHPGETMLDKYRHAQPSIDAIFPLHYIDGRYWYHAGPNVGLTLHAINLGKGVTLPGALQIISDYIKQDSPDKEELLRLMKGVYDVGLLVAYSRKDRLTQAVDQTWYAEIRKQFITCKLTSERVAAPTEWYGGSGDGGLSKDLAFRTRIKKMAALMEKEWNMQFRKSADGCPYPFHASTMPPNWDWSTAGKLFWRRNHRMKTDCNSKCFPKNPHCYVKSIASAHLTMDTAYWTLPIGHCLLDIASWTSDVRHRTTSDSQCSMLSPSVCRYRRNTFDSRLYLSVHTNKTLGRWEHVDTPETIWLECLWQQGNPDCKEFLNLPLCVDTRHLFRFAVAHKKHHEQMLTGWIVPHPTSLDDYDASQCNILIEAHFSNNLKKDFPEEVYPEILDAIKNIQVPKEYYTPDPDATVAADAPLIQVTNENIRQDILLLEGDAYDEFFMDDTEETFEDRDRQLAAEREEQLAEAEEALHDIEVQEQFLAELSQ